MGGPGFGVAPSPPACSCLGASGSPKASPPMRIFMFTAPIRDLDYIEVDVLQGHVQCLLGPIVSDLGGCV